MRKSRHFESRQRLEHILQAIDQIENYSKKQTKKSFCNNSLLNNAILFQFSIIGEAIIHVEEETLSAHDYPWHKLRSFRNLIAHEYFNIKLEAVWQIIMIDLPELKKVIHFAIQNSL